MVWAHPISGSEVGSPSRAAALAEIMAMFALVLSYIWGWHNLFAGDCLVVTFLYFALCHISRLRCRESARSLGLRLDNWRSAARQAYVPVAVAVSVPLATGAALGSWHFEPARLARYGARCRRGLTRPAPSLHSAIASLFAAAA